MQPVIRAYDAQIDDVDKVKRSVVARINTSNRDRYNTVILARGGTTKNWRSAGAPVLWEHGKDPRNFTDPIANSPRMWNNGGPNPTELIAEPIFRDNEFSQERFEMYRDGKVKGWSVNILPRIRSASPPTTEELRSRPDWEGVETVYREWDLAEFSGTVIPGNADAVTSDRAAAVFDLVQRNLLWLPDEVRPIYEAALTRTATESTGGASEGGELVKDCPDCGKPMRKGEGGCVCPKKAEPERSAPRTERYVDTDGQTWTVREPDGSPITPFRDATAAETALRLMGLPVVVDAFERLLYTAMAEQRSMDMKREEDLIARIELELFGRV